jgi:hypothetical protein
MLYTRTMDEQHMDGRPVDLESDDDEPDSDDEEQVHSNGPLRQLQPSDAMGRDTLKDRLLAM